MSESVSGFPRKGSPMFFKLDKKAFIAGPKIQTKSNQGLDQYFNLAFNA